MPLHEDDKVFNHSEVILELEREYLRVSRMRGVTLFEMKLITELGALRHELARLLREAQAKEFDF
jgi:hypothetical protein